MSTDTLIIDSPWHRLRWTLPTALAIGIATLWTIAYFAGKPEDRLPEPPAVEAQIVEIPPPAAAKAPERVEAVKSHQASVEKTPTPVSTPVKQTAPTQPAAPAQPKADALPVKETPAKQAPPPAVQEKSGTAPAGNSGAQAILRPMPQIPDELRQDALSATAIARFHVAADGTATVELVNPTPNPRLNRLLLDTLKNWRFFPSMKDGKPVASTQDISIKIDVK